MNIQPESAVQRGKRPPRGFLAPGDSGRNWRRSQNGRWLLEIPPLLLDGRQRLLGRRKLETRPPGGSGATQLPATAARAPQARDAATAAANASVPTPATAARAPQARDADVTLALARRRCGRQRLIGRRKARDSVYSGRTTPAAGCSRAARRLLDIVSSGHRAPSGFRRNARWPQFFRVAFFLYRGGVALRVFGAPCGPHPTWRRV
jgi:hypothetical protein